MDERTEITALIYKSFLTLDDLNFTEFLNLCAPNYHYKITAYSPEIRKEMIWLEESRQSLEQLFINLPKHNSDHSRLSRMGNVYLLDKTAPQEWSALTFLQVFRTVLDGGATELFAIGKIYDKITKTNTEFKLLDREIKLETRMFGFGHHIPF
jgi:methanesulfonate monooxygenase small subunit